MRSSVMVSPEPETNASSATITSRPRRREVLTTKPVTRWDDGSTITRRTLPASWPSLVRTFAPKSIRMPASLGRDAHRRRSRTRSSACPASSVRHVDVVAAPGPLPLDQSLDTALLAAERVEEPHRLLRREVFAEIRQRLVDARRRGGPRPAVARGGPPRLPTLPRRPLLWVLAARLRRLAGSRLLRLAWLRLPLLLGGLELREEPVDHFDVELRVSVGGIDLQGLDVRGARVGEPAEVEERVPAVVIRGRTRLALRPIERLLVRGQRACDVAELLERVPGVHRELGDARTLQLEVAISRERATHVAAREHRVRFIDLTDERVAATGDHQEERGGRDRGGTS